MKYLILILYCLACGKSDTVDYRGKYTTTLKFLGDDTYTPFDCSGIYTLTVVDTQTFSGSYAVLCTGSVSGSLTGTISVMPADDVVEIDLDGYTGKFYMITGSVNKAHTNGILVGYGISAVVFDSTLQVK